MADDRGQRDSAPEAWAGDPDGWQDVEPASGRPPRGAGQMFAPAPGWAAPPGYTTAPPAGTGRGGRGFTMAAMAIAAALIAAIVALIAVDVAGGQSPASPAGNAPPAQGPAGAANGGAGPVAGQGGAAGGGTLMMGGQVTKVSSTSITLSAQGHQVTAAITSSTTLSGVQSPSQIKPGDQITAQITGYGTPHPVAAAIQDPASIP